MITPGGLAAQRGLEHRLGDQVVWIESWLHHSITVILAPNNVSIYIICSLLHVSLALYTNPPANNKKS